MFHQQNSSDKWTEWHEEAYNDINSLPYQRTEIVKDLINKYLSEIDKDIVVISIGAGQSRDILPVLIGRKDNDRITTYLIDTDIECLNYAKNYAKDNNIINVHIVDMDGSLVKNYKDIPKADLIIFCGMMTQKNTDEVKKLANNIKLICNKDAQIIWSRHGYDKDYSTPFRNVFNENFYKELDFYISHKEPFFICRNIIMSNPLNIETKKDVKIFIFNEFA